MKRYWKQILIIMLVAALGLFGAYQILENTAYDTIEVVETHENIGTDNGNYIQYSDWVLKYSKDGVAMLNQEGKQLWNQSCQMTHPIVEMSDKAVVVADQGGTSILVFQENGLKGEIKTTRPIEKVAVSNQGIVGAILQDEDTPQVMCYDAKGNTLVSHKASLEKTGYPIDIALSKDGNVLLVSYLCIEGNVVRTKIVYYNFGESGTEKNDYQVAQAEYEDTIIPTTAFLDKDTSLLVSEHSFVLYEGLEEPKEKKKVELDKEIKSVVYNEDYIVFVLKNTDKTAYELRTYKADGSQVMTTEFEGEYANIKLSQKEIILYSGNNCAVFNMKGICKYQGTVESSIIDFFPISGLNRYMMISANGFEEIRLAK